MGLRLGERGEIVNNVAPASFIAFQAVLLLCEGSLSITNHFCLVSLVTNITNNRIIIITESRVAIR